MRITACSAAFFSFLCTVNAAYNLSYFDDLRKDSNITNNISSAYEKLWNVADNRGNTFGLAQITAFLPFSDGTNIRKGVQDDLAATLMAIHHFNNPELNPNWTPEHLADLAACNIKLTAEFHDDRFSPIDTTRLFTNILKQPNSFSQPHPAGVIGAYRSAVTSPLAILTGVNDIPQVSYAATSTDFDNKDQYPLFGRTIQSSTGEATVALQLFQSLNATHIAVLFVTDAFGSALQKAFQDAASEADIVTDSVAFSYSANLTGDEIPNAVESLKKTQYRTFFVIAFEAHYQAIMTAAYEQGLIGDDYLWIFDGLGESTFQYMANYLPGSPLAKATSGVGIINVAGGLRPEIVYPNVETVPPLEENPTTSYEKFRIAWRTFIEDPTFEEYARSRMPTSVKDMKGYDPKYTFSKESSGYTPFLYDAITGLGLALCRAANNITEGQTFGGKQVFQQFSSLSFNGASGNVTIISPYGTRDYTTELFTLFNVQPYEVDANGNETYMLVPTKYYSNGWKAIDDRMYVYANGGTVTPDSLPPPDLQMNYIGTTGRAVGYTLMALVALGSFAAFGWLFWYRRERVVRSSQALFLSMIAFGSLVMASSIVPLSFEEPMPESSLDAACMAAPWLYVSGAVIVVSALLAKTLAIRRTYLHPEVDVVHVNPVAIFGMFALLYLINFIVMLSWQLVAPLQWIRVYLDSKDVFDRYVDSYGLCSNDNALPFVIVIVILNISTLLVANWWAYQARNIETEYGESRYIGISMASILQAWCMGIPILIVVWDNPQAKFFVEAGIIFVTALAVLLLIFIPKSFAIRADRIKAAEENKRLAYSSFTNRARKSNSFPEELNPAASVIDDFNRFNGNEKVEEQISALQASEEAEALPDIPQQEHYDGAVAQESANASRSSLSRRSLLQNISKSFRFSLVNGESTEDNNAESFRGIRVTHNPRSMRNLQVTGGRELSRAQLDYMEGHRQYGDDGNMQGLSEIQESQDAEQGKRMIPSQ